MLEEIQEDYLKKTTLAMDLVPVVSQYDMFGLKGGTAINMYYRDLPRLSVDLDLAYLPHVPRRRDWQKSLSYRCFFTQRTRQT